MCTAQVILLSREVLMRRSTNTTRGVRRKLFATSDQSGPSEVLKKMQDQIRKRDAERWNFDFFTETPLPGRYEWVPVGGQASSSSMPKTVVSAKSKPVTRHTETIVQEIRTAPVKKSKKKDAGVTSQKKITDFMAKKKRPSTGEPSSKLKIRKVSSESLTTTARLA